MKKILATIFVVIISFGLFACSNFKKPGNNLDPEPPIEETPPVEEETPPVDEETPPVEEEIPPVEEEIELVINFSEPLEKGVSVNVSLDVTDFKEVKIEIISSYTFDTPVNFENFKVNNNTVDHNLTGTAYMFDHDFLIGDLNAKGSLINALNKTNILRLHTKHNEEEKPHYLIINVEDIETFGFDFLVTTAAFSSLESLVVTLTK